MFMVAANLPAPSIRYGGGCMHGNRQLKTRVLILVHPLYV